MPKRTDEVWHPLFVEALQRKSHVEYQLDILLENESKPQGQVTIKFGKGLIGRSFTSKSGIEMLQVKIPNRERTDKTPWESFAVPANMIHDNQYGKGVWMKLPEDGTTNATTFNRELLIVEKENDGKPFELHTSYEDKANYYSNLRNPWLLLLLLFGMLDAANRSLVAVIIALFSLVPVIVYQLQIVKLKREADTKEW